MAGTGAMERATPGRLREAHQRISTRNMEKRTRNAEAYREQAVELQQELAQKIAGNAKSISPEIISAWQTYKNSPKEKIKRAFGGHTDLQAYCHIAHNPTSLTPERLVQDIACSEMSRKANKTPSMDYQTFCRKYLPDITPVRFATLTHAAHLLTEQQPQDPNATDA